MVKLSTLSTTSFLMYLFVYGAHILKLENLASHQNDSLGPLYNFKWGGTHGLSIPRELTEAETLIWKDQWDIATCQYG